jgi:hypothetical protein
LFLRQKIRRIVGIEKKYYKNIAKSIGITPVALNSYINGFSKPTTECNDFILARINERFAASESSWVHAALDKPYDV